MNKTKCHNCNIEYYSSTGFTFPKCNHTQCPYCTSSKFLSALSVKYTAAFPKASINCACSASTVTLSVSDLYNKFKQFKLMHYDDSKICNLHQRKYLFWCKTCMKMQCDLCIKEHNLKHKMIEKEKFEEKTKIKIEKMKYKTYDELKTVIMANKFDVDKKEKQLTKEYIDKINYIIDVCTKIKENYEKQLEIEKQYYDIIEKTYEYYYFHLNHIQLYNFTKSITFDFSNVDIDIKPKEISLINHLYSVTKETISPYISKSSLSNEFSFIEFSNTLTPLNVKFPLISTSLFNLVHSIPITPMLPYSILQLTHNTIAVGLTYAHIECIYIYDTILFKLILALKGDEKAPPTCLVQVGDLLLSSSFLSPYIKIWKIDKAHKSYIKSFKAHLTPTTAMYNIPSTSLVISGSKDGEVIIWDISAMKQVTIIKPHILPLSQFIMLEATSEIVSSSYDGYIKLYNFIKNKNELIEEGKMFKAFAKIKGVSLIKTPSLIAAADSLGEISLWDVSKGVNVFTIKSHNSDINDIIYLKSSDKVLTCSNDKTMNVYDVINGNILRIAKSYKFESKVLKGLMLRDKRLAILSVNSVNIYTN